MLSQFSGSTQPALSRVLDISTMAERAPATDGMRVLLVHGDPEPELTRALAREGHDVLPVAEDGRPARFLGVFKPAVVLVVVRGTAELCRDLRRQAPRVPIVAIVPSRNLDEIIPALNAGADDCLGRPFHRAELIARLIAARRRGLRTAAASSSAAATTLEGAV